MKRNNEIDKQISKVNESNGYPKNNKNNGDSSNNNSINLILQNTLVDENMSESFSKYKFCAFKSVDNIFYIIYQNKSCSIIIYNVDDNKKSSEIKNFHNSEISIFLHFLDNYNKRDLILSISNDNITKLIYIKIWNFNNYECITCFNKICDSGWVSPLSSFLNEKNKIYIILSYSYTLDPIRIFDLNGNIIKEIKDINPKNDKYYIDNYYDSKLNKNYILIGCIGYVRSYDYKENKFYNTYLDKDDHSSFGNILITEDKGDVIKLIESSWNNFIRIWNFHSANLIYKIDMNKYSVYNNVFSICLYNKKYLFVGLRHLIVLIDVKEGKIVKNLINNDEKNRILKKAIHPKFGECLISHSDPNKIKLWIIKDDI